MPNIYNAGQLAVIIGKLGEMDIPDLGATSTIQNNYIYQFMNIALMKLARIAYQLTYSDPLAISTNGQYVFKTSGVAITDMFEPHEVLDSNDVEIKKRAYYSAAVGWWKDSQNQEIHFRGMAAGNYVLKYLKYPKRVTIDADTVEFPPSGYDALIKEVLSLIKYSKNSYAGAEFMDGKAKVSISEATQGAISARGFGSSGQAPSPMDTTITRGG